MKDINFLSSNDKDSAGEANARQYDIEYTTPQVDQPAQQSKPKKSWFSSLRGGTHKKSSSHKDTKHTDADIQADIQTAQHVVQHVTNKSNRTARSTTTSTSTFAPTSTPASTSANAKFAPAVSAPVVPIIAQAPPVQVVSPQQSVQKNVQPVANVISSVQKFQIPLAPPPPVHARPVPSHAVQKNQSVTLQQPAIQPSAMPVAQSNAQPNVIPVAQPKPVSAVSEKMVPEEVTMPIRPVSIPVAPPAPVHPVAPTAPVTPTHPVIPTAPMQVQKPMKYVTQSSAQPSVPTNGGVHTQHVSDIKGQETDPKRLPKGMAGVNLLPTDSGPIHDQDPPTTRLLKLTLTTLSLITLVYFGMVVYQSYFITQTTQVYKDIDAVEQEIYTYRDLQTQVNEVNTTIEQVSGILDAHIYWTQFFTMLEEYTLPNVHYSSFSGDVVGHINLQADTTDFASVSRQIAVFEEATDFVTDVSVNTATRSVQASVDTEGSGADSIETTSVTESPDSKVTFALSLQINPDIFYYHSNGSN